MIATILHIILLILKIIGITLGILIGVILLVLCAALFVPMCYHIEAKRTEGEGNPPVEVMARFNWFLHFINARVDYSSELKLRLRILFLTILSIPAKRKKSRRSTGRRSKDKSGKRSKNKSGKKSENKTAAEEKRNTDSEYAVKDEKVSPDKSKKTEKSENKEKVDKDIDNKIDQLSQQEGYEEDTEQKLSIKEKLIKIWYFFKNIPYTIREICDRIKWMFENIEYYLDIIKGDMFKSSFGLCKGELVSIFSYIKPRNIKAEIIIGAGDPAATGQIIAYYYAILYPYIGSDVTIVGDFDNKRIEGTVLIKGKVKLFTFMKAVIRIYFNKDIKALLKLFKKEDE